MDVLINVMIFLGLVVLVLFGIKAVRKDRFSGVGRPIGNALQGFQAMLEPGERHLIEEQQREHENEDESGDPPEAGGEREARQEREGR